MLIHHKKKGGYDIIKTNFSLSGEWLYSNCSEFVSHYDCQEP